MVALITVEGATNGEVFTAFVREMLAPTLREGDIVGLNHPGAQRSRAARAAVEDKGVCFVCLPPFAPDLNPMERCWLKSNTALRAAEARTRGALEEAIKQAIAKVS